MVWGIWSKARRRARKISMRVVIQRVREARVEVEGSVVGSIGGGLLVLVGIGQKDRREEAEKLVQKVVNLRIFEDGEGKMNRSVLEEGGGLLLVSQFTLWADCRKGRRPSFTEAMGPEAAKLFFERVVEICRRYPLKVETGVFGADMQVFLCNDGPVTIVMDSEEWIGKEKSDGVGVG